MGLPDPMHLTREHGNSFIFLMKGTNDILHPLSASKLFTQALNFLAEKENFSIAYTRLKKEKERTGEIFYFKKTVNKL